VSNPKRPLKIGLLLPDTTAEMAGGGTLRWAGFKAMARRAEEAGFDSLWMADHLLWRFEGLPADGPWEAWSVLAALAEATDRAELGTLVTCTGFRNPALLAKIAATVDEISGGRLILGLGAGWHEPEYRAFGYPFDHRVSRFEEAFAIVRGLLRDGRVDCEGAFYSARDCELIPRGPRPQGPPLMIGSTGARMLRLTAEHADLWNGLAWGHAGAADLRPDLAKVDAACAVVGRDPATLGRTASVMVALPGWEAAALPMFHQVPGLTGTPEALADVLRGYAKEGISHLQVLLAPNSLAGVEAFAPVLGLLDRG
jgi:alkanesulfonate monooxygenase SsuD/methylene tetrahydromethanopterin reductase-like flavin-dependent oxidoreductase (luciferase family)